MTKRLNIALLIIVFMLSCANPLPPPGGPADTTPPEIAEHFPENGALNFGDNEITLEFSKYMNNNSVIENIYITPEAEMEFDWSGKELEIEFINPLDSNTTYALYAGTEYSDYRSNKPTESFSLIFSTGPQIDSGHIDGKVYGDKPDGGYIFGYGISKTVSDTFDINKTKPNYRVQIGSTGKFSLKALKQGDYLLFYIKDQYKDGGYDEGTDLFCAPSGIVSLDSSGFARLDLKSGTTFDKAGPALFNVEHIFDRRLKVNFSEEIDTSSIVKENFRITDSSGLEEVKILSAYFSEQSTTSAELVINRDLDTNKSWLLKVKNIIDTTGLVIADTSSVASFYSNIEPDTLRPGLTSISVKDSSKDVGIDHVIKFQFNTGINDFSAEKISLIRLSDSSKVEIGIDNSLDNLVAIKPVNGFESKVWYRLKWQFDSLKSVSGAMILKDSLIEIDFYALETMDYAKVSGIVKDSCDCSGKLVVNLISSKNKVFSILVDEFGNFSNTKTPEGVYHLEVFCDENENLKYDYGNSYPFKFSEKFFRYKNEIKVKARWETKTPIIIFKCNEE